LVSRGSYSSLARHAKKVHSGIAAAVPYMPACNGAGMPDEESFMTTCVFVQIRCTPGKTYKVAEAIALREIHSELYSTSGEYDLLMKLYIPENEDVGKFINENLLTIEGIERSMTTMTFKVF
jgi:DNA-binding Lrp family transcriptional regulator